MATMSYQQFLKGRQSTSALAKLWDAKYNGGQRFGPAAQRRAAGDARVSDNSSGYPTPKPPPPEFDPSVLDQQGESERTNLDFQNRQRMSGIDTDYAQQKAEIDAQRPLLEYDRNQGYEQADSNAAARGVFNSGIRSENRGRVFRDFSNNSQALDRRDTALTNWRQREQDTQNADYQDRLLGIRSGAAQRRYQRWVDEQGI